MSQPEASKIRLHEDAALFREAVNFTAAETAFAPRLIEKDYFSTVLLSHLAVLSDKCVFKGGACLAKVHAGFYRMSEDLDFSISMPINAPRAKRSHEAAGIKKSVAALPGAFPCFSIIEPMRGANNSTQYNGAVGYTSLLDEQPERINIEVGLREPLLTHAANLQAKTVLISPITGEAMLAPINVPCLSLIEAFAEKFRAALTRRDVAIRDFFDLDFAFQRQKLLPQDDPFVVLVRKKLTIPGNDPLDVSPKRFDALRGQLDAQLKPVLRARDFRAFDLNRAMKMVSAMAHRVV